MFCYSSVMSKHLCEQTPLVAERAERQLIPTRRELYEMDDDRIQVAFQTRMGERLVDMTSTLVETISINYEDFNESFLTCGTCLCVYDGHEHTPKLLQCSHTVCLHCLGRIAASAAPTATLTSISTSALAQRDPPTPATFRCPICRELITVPRGGVAALPPSFLVNQLLDLIHSQRREVIPKCSTHSNQELLFCETCDSVFCAACVTNPHNSSLLTGDHTVIPFSIAIKRMSEILLYKANECLSKLDEAGDNVSGEIQKLDTAADSAADLTTKAFDEAVAVLEKKKQLYITKIRDLASKKKEKLKEQLELIEKERKKVRDTCDGLEYQVEVRHITKRISELSSQLDSFISLRHPRENAYIVCKTESDLKSLDCVVSTEVRTSTTYPPLCTLRSDSNNLLACGIEVEIILETKDYHNDCRKEGGDPVKVTVKRPNKEELLPNVEDNEDGTYSIKFIPLEVGTYTINAEIFGRAIKDENLLVEISEHNNPLKVWGKGELCQPVSVTKSDFGELFVLDTGNGRIVVLDQDINLKRIIQNETLQGRSCTGIAYCVQSQSLLVVNWRSKEVTRLNHRDGTTMEKFTHSEFSEPIGISVDGKEGKIYVADNGVRTIFVFDAQGNLDSRIQRDNFALLGGVSVSSDGKTIIVADMSLFIINPGSTSGPDKEIKVPGKGRFGGVAVDGDGTIVVTRTEKTKSFVQIFKDNKLVSTIDSFSSKMKRPSALAIVSHKNLLVVDLGNDCVKKYRYK